MFFVKFPIGQVTHDLTYTYLLAEKSIQMGTNRDFWVFFTFSATFLQIPRDL